jgi:hypothetical protein
MDQLVVEFEENGWRWRDHGIEVAEMRAENEERGSPV